MKRFLFEELLMTVNEPSMTHATLGNLKPGHAIQQLHLFTNFLFLLGEGQGNVFFLGGGGNILFIFFSIREYRQQLSKLTLKIIFIQEY